ncbi:hypothetical protein Drorol1_Dr00010716 [Drosera rotundifolia]
MLTLVWIRRCCCVSHHVLLPKGLKLHQKMCQLKMMEHRRACISSPRKQPYKVNDRKPSMKQESARNSVDSTKMITNQENAQDPCGSDVAFKGTDVGPYKHIYTIEAGSIDVKRKRNVMFLLHKLRSCSGSLLSS